MIADPCIFDMGARRRRRPFVGYGSKMALRSLQDLEKQGIGPLTICACLVLFALICARFALFPLMCAGLAL